MEFDPGPEIIFEYFDDLDSTQQQQIRQLAELYQYWNQQINVISRKDLSVFYLNHVLHSLAIAKITRFSPKDRVLDVGTGGGFPGIPLAILFPETSFHLVDSTGKKIKVVREIVNALKLENVSCEQIRVEELKGSYNFVLTRAVARLSKLIDWVQACGAPGCKLICLKGGDLDAEIREVKNKVSGYRLSDHFQEPFFETKQLLEVGL